MTKARINIQHDYITLRIKWADKRTLNFTKSYGGYKASGTEATREALAFLMAWTKKQTTTPGEYFKRLCEAAQASTEIQDFLMRVA
jgi:hypothetical protein